jgi:hypothetical protein
MRKTRRAAREKEIDLSLIGCRSRSYGRSRSRETSPVRSAASATSANASASHIEAFAPCPPAGVIGCAASPISAAPLATYEPA